MKIFTKKAYLANGWANNVRLHINIEGQITNVEVEVNKTLEDKVLENRILVPAMSNLHSHSFQRAISGLTEKRLNQKDNFWSWRNLMYRFLERLTPEHLEAIAALVFMEMLECGYSSVAEFHYVHHQNSGEHYENIAETSHRIIEAAQSTGIGLTHLPVLYMQAGLAKEELTDSQKRFGNQLDDFYLLLDEAEKAIKTAPNDFLLGTAPHSLRAVSSEALKEIAQFHKTAPIHIHIAEQIKEVEQVQAHFGKRPVEWLLNQSQVDSRWCLIHATHLTQTETDELAKTGATAGLCPITEANLGDGIFNGSRFISVGGKYGIGSDSNVRVSLVEELRILEYSQRLNFKERNVMTTRNGSTGLSLYQAALAGGAQSLGRKTGKIESGYWADLLTLDADSLHLWECSDDEIFDRWIFSADDQLVREVWSAGRLLVENGRHIHHTEIENQFRETMKKLQQG